MSDALGHGALRRRTRIRTHRVTSPATTAADAPRPVLAWRRMQDRRRLRAIAGRAERLTLRDLLRFLQARFLSR